MKSGNALAWLLIIFGGLFLLGKFGLGLGFLMGLIVPILVILLGVFAWKNGSRLIGGVIAIIGVFMLLGKLSTVIFWLAAIAAVVIGISMLTRSKNRF
jgi:hypothetical protein